MKRPYRLWNTATKNWERYHYYAYKQRAMIGALINCKWQKPGTTIEVINVDTNHMLAQYTRTPNSIKFMKG